MSIEKLIAETTTTISLTTFNNYVKYLTVFTVGFGDIYPVTLGGRLFTFFVLMLGLGLVVLPVGILA